MQVTIVDHATLFCHDDTIQEKQFRSSRYWYRDRFSTIMAGIEAARAEEALEEDSTAT